MTSRPPLPPDLEAWLATHPDLAPGDLAPPWRLAEGANPLDAAPLPRTERIRAIRATLDQTAANGTVGPAARPALRLVSANRFRFGMAIAASVAVLVAAGVYLWNRPVTISAPPGAVASVPLPDGSEAHLNSGSTLTYARRFGRQARRVRLDGEAFFDVAQTGAPFAVETFNAHVAVVGTSFNVRARPGDPTAETVVSVVTGVVEVSARRRPDRTMRLEAGETARVNADAPAPLAVPDASMATAWRNGRFVFINQPLGVMFDEIERRYGIEIAASEKIRRHSHNIRTTADSAEQLVSELCQSSVSLSLRYRAMANGFEVFEE